MLLTLRLKGREERFWIDLKGRKEGNGKDNGEGNGVDNGVGNGEVMVERQCVVGNEW